MVNKIIAQYFGSNDAAVVIAHLVFLDGLFEGREFYQQQERLARDCNVAVHTLRGIIKRLTQEGVLTVEKKGLPAKNYYKLNVKVLEQILYHEEVEQVDVVAIKEEVKQEKRTSYRIRLLQEGLANIDNLHNVSIQDLEHLELLEYKKVEDYSEKDNKLLQRLEAYVAFS
jgi:stalled ribosome rescue protein Dom34